jgi:hypothetical protein
VCSKEYEVFGQHMLRCIFVLAGMRGFYSTHGEIYFVFPSWNGRGFIGTF